MTDARIVATNPADSSVVPVACNANGELLLAEGTTDQYVLKDGDTMTGNLHLGDNIILNPDGSAQFAGGAVDVYDNGNVVVENRAVIGGSPSSSDGIKQGVLIDQGGYLIGARDEPDAPVIITRSSGSVTNTIELKAGGDLTVKGEIRCRDVLIHDITLTGDKPSNDSDWDYLQLLQRPRAGSGSWPQVKFGLRSYSTNDYARSMFGIYLKYNYNDDTPPQFTFSSSGKFAATSGASFKGDVVVGSRSKQWMIVESNGIAHLIEQTRINDNESEDAPTNYPELRNIPQELTMVEQALGEVMEKLRMTPPAGWEVWDGSDGN